MERIREHSTRRNPKQRARIIPVARFVGHEGPIQAIQYTVNGQYCITGGIDRTVRLWNPQRIDPTSSTGATHGSRSNTTSASSYPHSSTSYQGPSSSSIINNNNNNNNNNNSINNSYTALPQALPVQVYTDGYTYPITAVTFVYDNSSNNNNNDGSSIIRDPNGSGKRRRNHWKNNTSLYEIANDSASYYSSSSSSPPPHSIIAASDKMLIQTDLMTQQILHRWTGSTTGRINAVSVPMQSRATNAPHTILVTGSYDATVRIWDLRCRRRTATSSSSSGMNTTAVPIQTLAQAKDSITDVWTPSSSTGTSETAACIRSSSVDGILRTYDIRMGMLTQDDVGCPITSFAVTTDHGVVDPVIGRHTESTTADMSPLIAISGMDGVIRILQAWTGQVLYRCSNQHTAGTYGIPCRWAADNQTIVTGSEDGSVVLYHLPPIHDNTSLSSIGMDDATSTETIEVTKLHGPTRPTCAIATNPIDSSVIVSGSFDDTITVWADRWEYVQ